MGLTRVADSSFLIAAYDEEDPRTETALRWLSEAEPILVPPEVLAETLGVVHRRRGFKHAQAIWVHLSTLPHVRLAKVSDVEATAILWNREPGRLSWVDWTVVRWARALGASVLCFDPGIEAQVHDRA